MIAQNTRTEASEAELSDAAEILTNLQIVKLTVPSASEAIYDYALINNDKRGLRKYSQMVNWTFASTLHTANNKNSLISLSFATKHGTLLTSFGANGSDLVTGIYFSRLR